MKLHDLMRDHIVKDSINLKHDLTLASSPGLTSPAAMILKPVAGFFARQMRMMKPKGVATLSMRIRSCSALRMASCSTSSSFCTCTHWHAAHTSRNLVAMAKTWGSHNKLLDSAFCSA